MVSSLLQADRDGTLLEVGDIVQIIAAVDAGVDAMI